MAFTFTQADVDALLANKSEEGLYLEFKAGAALTTSADRGELVKDCTGFANAAGGLLIYGIAEQEVRGSKVASHLDPVQDAGATPDWYTQVIHGNSAPPFGNFEISEVVLAGGGRIVAVNISEASTAHQNLRDCKYYQRAGRKTAPMEDYHVRDVMGRRVKPVADVQITLPAMLRTGDLHRYYLSVRVQNIGLVTLEKWSLEIDIPADVVRDTRHVGVDQMRMDPRFGQICRPFQLKRQKQVQRITLADPGLSGTRRIIHPGQEVLFDNRHPGFCEVLVEVNDELWAPLSKNGGEPITWRLYLQNSQPQAGEIAFEDWCQF